MLETTVAMVTIRNSMKLMFVVMVTLHFIKTPYHLIHQIIAQTLLSMFDTFKSWFSTVYSQLLMFFVAVFHSLSIIGEKSVITISVSPSISIAIVVPFLSDARCIFRKHSSTLCNYFIDLIDVINDRCYGYNKKFTENGVRCHGNT